MPVRWDESSPHCENLMSDKSFLKKTHKMRGIRKNQNLVEEFNRDDIHKRIQEYI